MLAHLGALKELEGVEYAEPDYYIQSVVTPTDSQWKDQWALTNIEANRAWEIGTGSRDARVGVIDSGINYLHPDLKNNIWKNPI